MSRQQKEGGGQTVKSLRHFCRDIFQEYLANSLQIIHMYSQTRL